MDEIGLQQLAQITQGELLQDQNKGNIDYLLTDSRTLTYAPSTCFFAIASDRNDGHKYIYSLYEKGVRNFVISTPIVMNALPKASILKVDDVVDALQKMAMLKRKQFQGTMVAITGSNGKTIVKEWLYQVLNPGFLVTRSPKSYNSQIGVALSLWNMDLSADIALIEAGISEPGEMEKLAQIILPDVVVLTNLGSAHQQNFSSYEEKAREKVKLTTGAKAAFYNRDYELLEKELQKYFSGDKLKSWSLKTNAEKHVYIASTAEGTQITVTDKNEADSFQIPFTDEASIENAVHVFEVAKYLGCPLEKLMQQMQCLEPVEMRLQIKDGLNGCKIINDAYNSDFNSLSIALNFLKQQAEAQGLSKTLILSDIHQTTQNKSGLYQEVSQLIQTYKIDRLVAIGNDCKDFLSVPDVKVTFFPDTQSYLKSFRQSDFQDEVVLIKGARVFGFEQISTLLERKLHKTVLEINLTSMLHNFHYYKSLLQPTTKMMAMVKAFAYGSGSFEVARLLQYHGCDYLAVAVADEGVDLRRNGIKIPILVLAPEQQSFRAMIENELEPEIYGLNELKGFIDQAAQMGISGYPIHLKLDTGMHRLGFMEGQFKSLLNVLKNSPEVRVKSIFSHLAGADEKVFDAFSRQQIHTYKKLVAKIEQGLGYEPIKHILNSAGIERFNTDQMNMVRLGIGLYGVNVENPDKVRQAATFKTNVVQTREIPANETVGYGRKGHVSKPSKIATIPVGYADGLNRKLSNGVGEVLVNGQRAPIIGNICMDLTMINVTDLEVKEGDEVILFGENLSISEIADKLETIPYEVLTSVSQRVKRVYVTE